MTSRLFLGWVVLLSVACGSSGSTPTAPSAGSRSGTWSGTVSDSANGTGTLRLVLDDRVVSATESFITGTWTATFPDASRNGSGVVAGGATDATMFLNLAPTTPPTCPIPPLFPAAVGSYNATRLSVGATTIRGDYVFGTCTGTVNGTLELRR